ncbi:hypothetical protein L1887_25504 [Cichorium endivia]|nr:hypothetical protein L1887_25504 [Cichorium endivia]
MEMQNTFWSRGTQLRVLKYLPLEVAITTPVEEEDIEIEVGIKEDIDVAAETQEHTEIEYTTCIDRSTNQPPTTNDHHDLLPHATPSSPPPNPEKFGAIALNFVSRSHLGFVS